MLSLFSLDDSSSSYPVGFRCQKTHYFPLLTFWFKPTSRGHPKSFSLESFSENPASNLFDAVIITVKPSPSLFESHESYEPPTKDELAQAQSLLYQ